MKVEIDGTGTISVVDVPDGHIFFKYNKFFLRMSNDLHIVQSGKIFTYGIELSDSPRVTRFSPSEAVNLVGEAKIGVVDD